MPKLRFARPQISAEVSQGMLSWAWRWIVTSFTMIALLITILIIVPMFLKPAENGGIHLGFALNQFLAVLTVCYCVFCVPFFLLPTEHGDRYHWFAWTAIGWIASLLGSLVYLKSLDLLVIHDMPSEWLQQPNVMIGIVSGIFLLAMILALSIRGFETSSLVALAVLLVAGPLIAGDLFSLHSIANGIKRITSEQTNGVLHQVVIVALSVLVAGMILSLSLPKDWDSACETLLTFLLLWMIAMGFLACWGIFKKEIVLLNTNHEAIFHAIVATCFAAPFVNWFGMPWANGRRLGWSLCFAISLLTMTYVLNEVEVGNGKRIISYIFDRYDGPRFSVDFW